MDTFTVNPKCVSMGELYGETDPNTFEWSDGLISTATRRFAREMAAMSPDESIASRPASGITAISVSIHVNMVYLARRLSSFIHSYESNERS